jgi:hypothetical protein
MVPSLERIRADSASLDLVWVHEQIAVHARIHKNAKKIVVLRIISLAIVDDNLSGILRIVPGEMDAMRWEVNC